MKQLKHSLQNFCQNFSFEGVQSPKREKLVCARSRMNEISQVEIILFSKTTVQFLLRDDKHVIVQVLA